MIKKEFVLFQENFLFTPPDKTKEDKLSFELVSCVNRLFQTSMKSQKHVTD